MRELGSGENPPGFHRRPLRISRRNVSFQLGHDV
jgi:hypothetical protein